MSDKTMLPIDLTYLKYLSSGNAAIERKMLQLYISEVGKDVQKMTEAYVNSEMATIADVCHKLKSSVQLVGYEYLLDVLSTIETFRDKTALTSEEQALFEYLINQLKHSFIEINVALNQ